jgi:hypothetical protein
MCPAGLRNYFDQAAELQKNLHKKIPNSFHSSALPHIQEIADSNFGLETGYTNYYFMASSPPR